MNENIDGGSDEFPRVLEALKNCLQLYRNLGREICELHLENAGITNDDLQQFLDGNKIGKNYH